MKARKTLRNEGIELSEWDRNVHPDRHWVTMPHSHPRQTLLVGTRNQLVEPELGWWWRGSGGTAVGEVREDFGRVSSSEFPVGSDFGVYRITAEFGNWVQCTLQWRP